uniref:Uncharacterized protein n=1 Tax=Arundo donax TaxID=35708 RepID=A0A0A9F6Q1_ARUDO
MYLKSTKSKYQDTNVPVKRICDSLRQVSKMNTSSPARHSDSIPSHLASYMKVEPCGISGFECLEISCKYGSHGQ